MFRLFYTLYVILLRRSPPECTLRVEWLNEWNQWGFASFISCKILNQFAFMFMCKCREKMTRSIKSDWPSGTVWGLRSGESSSVALGTFRSKSFTPPLREMWDLSTMQEKLELSDESTSYIGWEFDRNNTFVSVFVFFLFFFCKYLYWVVETQ